MTRELDARERAVVLAYRTSPETVGQICRRLGLSNSQVYAILRAAGEPFRRPASARPTRVTRRGLGIATSQLLGLDAPRGAAKDEDEPVSLRLERLLVGQIVDLEDRSGPGRTVDPERAARALALNARTFATLRRADPAAGADDTRPTDHPAAPARSLAELRDELRGHLERIRDEERARRGLGEAEPDRG